jgi:hypothetical protein
VFLSSTVIFTYSVSKTSQCISLLTLKTASASFGFDESLTVSILRQLKKYVNKYMEIYLINQSYYLKMFIAFIFYVHVCILSQVWWVAHLLQIGNTLSTHNFCLGKSFGKKRSIRRNGIELQNSKESENIIF